MRGPNGLQRPFDDALLQRQSSPRVATRGVGTERRHACIRRQPLRLACEPVRIHSPSQSICEHQAVIRIGAAGGKSLLDLGLSMRGQHGNRRRVRGLLSVVTHESWSLRCGGSEHCQASPRCPRQRGDCYPDQRPPISNREPRISACLSKLQDAKPHRAGDRSRRHERFAIDRQSKPGLWGASAVEAQYLPRDFWRASQFAQRLGRDAESVNNCMYVAHSLQGASPWSRAFRRTQLARLLGVLRGADGRGATAYSLDLVPI